MINFIIAVCGFILLCLFLAKFVLTPLFKKFPKLDTLLKTYLAIDLIRMFR
jgi:Kef-type K+ transport system membrane component KefB